MTWSQKVIDWHHTHGRHHLPWQQNITPYRVWVSEVMLQQTTVNTVLSYFPKFIEKYPTIEALSTADYQDVLTLWSGLGYYRRAKYLYQGARTLCSEYQGQWPSTLKELMKIPGIGRSTAGALLSLGMNKRGVILDGNVKRVLQRVYGITTPTNDSGTMKKLFELAQDAHPQDHHRTYSQAMMDIGATLCHVKSPHCDACPIQHDCHTHHHQLWDQIPAKAKRKKPESISLHLSLYTDGMHVLLCQQPDTGLWADTWLPPISEEKTPLHGSFTHVLTHRRIKVYPHVIHVTQPPNIPCARWLKIDEDGIPKTKILTKCLAHIKHYI